MKIALKLFICISLIGCSQSVKNVPEKTSPFTAIEWDGELPKVKLDEKWYYFEGLDSLSRDEIVSYCKKEYKDKWKKRFAEDLVEVLNGMDYEPSIEVSLSLRKGNQTSNHKGIFNEENRKKIMLHRDKLGLQDPVEREKLKRKFKYFAANPKMKKEILLEAEEVGDTAMVKLYEELFEELANDINQMVSKDQISADLKFLVDHIEHKYSYADFRQFDYKRKIQELKHNLQTPMPRREFAIEIQKYLAQFGDGHTRVQGISGMLPNGYLPFIVAPFQNKVLCIHKNGTTLLNDQYPYLSVVNGVKVADLIKESGKLIADGSPQFKQHQSVYRLSFISYLLKQNNALNDGNLEIILENENGEIKRVELKISEKRIRSTELPKEHYLTKNNIGYLRIPSMVSNQQHLNELKSKIEEYKITEGLIIDIRDNTGGSRKILRLLAPYFLPKNHPPLVVNAAVYRTNEKTFPQEGFLANRFLYPIESKEFNEQSKNSIRRFLDNFKPAWKYAENKYSQMHFFVIEPNDQAFHYEKPVAVLINSNCFSATDIFAAAFKELPNVTLIGEKTGGGSGRSQAYILPNSEIEVRLSTMVSYQPNGQLFEGNGVSPDIEIKESISDILRKTDTQLDKALEIIIGKNTDAKN